MRASNASLIPTLGLVGFQSYDFAELLQELWASAKVMYANAGAFFACRMVKCGHDSTAPTSFQARRSERGPKSFHQHSL